MLPCLPVANDRRLLTYSLPGTEVYDSLQGHVGYRHVPVTAWADKVALAVYTCVQMHGSPRSRVAFGLELRP